MKILITGCAGFIGFHLSKKLLEKNHIVYGIDNLNNYYDVTLKNDRLKILKKFSKFHFYKLDISNSINLKKNFKKNNYEIVINLAAQAGVRYSIKSPDEYFKSNILGFYNILNFSNEFSIKHLLYASTSSVYGKKNKFPLNENDNTDFPLSFYAASKKCNEVMAYSFSNIYKLPCTGFRFFTVFGPYGRPDMALFKFIKSMLSGKEIELYNKGNHIRDFTYVDDIISAIYKLIRKKPKQSVPHEIYNLGSDNPVSLKKFLKIIEKNLNLKSKKILLPLQIGDVHKTHANTKKIKKSIKFKPSNNIEKNIKKFINWYKVYYKIV